MKCVREGQHGVKVGLMHRGTYPLLFSDSCYGESLGNTRSFSITYVLWTLHNHCCPSYSELSHARRAWLVCHEGMGGVTPAW
jgi:hypothetical protein